MPQLEIPFRQWLPDQPDLNNPGLVEAKNVYRLNGSYHPIKDIQYPGSPSSLSLGVTTSVDVKFGHSSFLSNTEMYSFLEYTSAFSGKLIKIDLSDDTISTTAISAPGGCNFVQFGDKIYYFGGSDVFEASRFGGFSAVSTENIGPDAAARIGNFIMTGAGYRLRWSGFNDPTTYVPSDLTQSGFADIEAEDLGYVTAILGGSRGGYIFQAFGVSRITYVGPPKIWDVRVISREYGAVWQGAIQVGGLAYFIGGSGSDQANLNGSGSLSIFKTNGSQVQRVSSGKVDDWLTENFSTSETELHPRQAIYHSTSKNIIWASGTGDATHKYLCMNVETDEFSYFENDFRMLIPGPFHNDVNSAEIMAVGENSGNLHFGPLSGDALEATLTTGHISNAGSRAFVDQVEPQYIGSGATVALSAKERLRDDASFSSYVAEEATTGIVDIRADGRAVAASVKFPAASNWSDFSGVVADASEAGKR